MAARRRRTAAAVRRKGGRDSKSIRWRESGIAENSWLETIAWQIAWRRRRCGGSRMAAAALGSGKSERRHIGVARRRGGAAETATCIISASGGGSWQHLLAKMPSLATSARRNQPIRRWRAAAAWRAARR
jgi:hypothetical protein